VFKPYRESIRGTLSSARIADRSRTRAAPGIQAFRHVHRGSAGVDTIVHRAAGASPGLVAGQPIAGSISQIAGQMGVPPGRRGNGPHV
jgi:hypothetical protein